MTLRHDGTRHRGGRRGPAAARPRAPGRTRSPRDGPAGAAPGRVSSLRSPSSHGAERPARGCARPARTRRAGWRRGCRSADGAPRCARSRRLPPRESAPDVSRAWRNRCAARGRRPRRRWRADRAGPTCAPAAALGLLAGLCQSEGIGVVAEGEQQRDGEGGARGQAGPDRERARHPGGATASAEVGRGSSPAARAASAGTGAVSPKAISSGLPGELVRVDPEEEAAGLRREA